MRRIVWLLAPCVVGWAAVATTSGQQPATKPTQTKGQNPATKAAPATDRDAPAKNAGAAQAKAKAAARPDPEAERKLDELLSEWEVQSAQIKTLDVTFYRKDVSKVVGDVEYYEGRALLQSPNLAVLDTKKIKLAQDEAKLFEEARKAVGPDGKWARDPNIIPADRVSFFDRIVCSGESIFHYDGAVRQIFEYPLAKNQQAAMMQQGPLPFLFNMKKEQVLQRYTMKLAQEDATKYVVQVVPKEAMDRNAFKQAVIYLNKKTFLPDMLVLVESNDNMQLHYLVKLEPNKEIKAENFHHNPQAWKNWPLVKNQPLGEQQGAGPVVPGRAAAKDGPAAQPKPMKR